MSQPIVQVDAFASEPFRGNPAAVCLLTAPRPEEWMQHVAREMNLSETAFLVPDGQDFQLRWFTPAVEVDLCGHATLASAHVLWEQGVVPGDLPVSFHTNSGLLTAAKRGEWIEMDFPSEPPRPMQSSPALARALGAKPRFVGRNRFDLLVELASPAEVEKLRPDVAALAALPARGIIITAAATKGEFDFVSRFFAPAAGVDEDPVTGSAHCCLAPFWTKRLGRSALTGYQASARGGVVRVVQCEDRVRICGQAVTVLTGHLHV